MARRFKVTKCFVMQNLCLNLKLNLFFLFSDLNDGYSVHVFEFLKLINVIYDDIQKSCCEDKFTAAKLVAEH